MITTVRDPVCGMDVPPTQFEMIFEGIHYAFCSEQCRERFVANPHLYIGMPGKKAPKQKGVELFKQRRFQLDTPLTSQDAAILAEALGAMMGVKAIEIQGDVTVTITYDLLQTTASQLEAKMVEVGINFGDGWSERLRRSFVHYIEECEVDNLEVHSRHGHG